MDRREKWLLRALLLEKVIQHALITWAFVAGRFGLRDDVAVDYRWLAVTGGVAGVLWAITLAGHVSGRRWSLWLAVGLATFDIVGEFVAQGTVSIIVTVSFLVAIILLVLAWRELRRTRAAASDHVEQSSTS